MTKQTNKVFTLLFWKYLERFSVQGISFIVTLILARILSPDDYGIVVLATVFINIANVFIQSGFNVAIIQRQDVKKSDFSTVFLINLMISVVLYSFLFITAPWLESFFDVYQFSDVLRTMGIVLVFGAVISITETILIKELEFQSIFISNFIAVIISAFVGIYLAMNEYGIWAIVFQQLVQKGAYSLILIIRTRWMPRLVFDKNRALLMFDFGWKVLVSSLLDAFYNQTYNIVIGKLFPEQTLAYYNRGREFPYFLVVNIDSSIESVMLPIYAKHQENLYELKMILKRVMKLSSYIVFPILIGLFCVARPLVLLLLGEKWAGAIPFVQIYALAFIFHPLNMANTQAINSIGRSDVYLRINIIKKIIAVLILVGSIPFGIYGIALGSVISGLVFVGLNIFPNKQLLDYGIKEQFTDVLYNLLSSSVMGLFVYLISFLQIKLIYMLLLQIIIGIIFYVVLSWIFKVDSFFYILNIFQNLLNNVNVKRIVRVILFTISILLMVVLIYRFINIDESNRILGKIEPKDIIYVDSKIDEGITGLAKNDSKFIVATCGLKSVGENEFKSKLYFLDQEFNISNNDSLILYDKIDTLKDIQGISIDEKDNILFTSPNENKIYKISNEKDIKTYINISSPNSIQYDSKNDKYWVLQRNQGLLFNKHAILLSFNYKWEIINKIPIKNNAVDQIYIDEKNEMIYITCGDDYSESNKLVVVDISNSKVLGSVIIQESYASEGLVLDSDYIYVANDGKFHNTVYNTNYIAVYDKSKLEVILIGIENNKGDTKYE